MYEEGYKFQIVLLKNIVVKLLFDLKYFGFKIAIFNFLANFPNYTRKYHYFISKKQHKYVSNFLKTKYYDLIEEYKSKNIVEGINSKKIWCLWWQGLENAPDLVKKCISSIDEYSGDYELIIISKYNYFEYFTLPDEIITKLKNNEISVTHLSDIIRARILSLYGGIWVDATMLFYGHVFNEFDDVVFNSVIINEGSWLDFFVKGRWCGFFMGGKSNKLFLFLYEFLIQYNLDYPKLINYFLIDYVIEIAYDSFSECREYIDNANLLNSKIFYLEENFSKTFIETEFNELCDNHKFFKLSFKHKYDSYDEKGNITIFKHFKDS